jgi:hypothetical protein
MKFPFPFRERKDVFKIISVLSVILVVLLTFPTGLGILRLGVLLCIALIYLGILNLSRAIKNGLKLVLMQIG